MPNDRYALVIACSEYRDNGLKQLKRPGQDAIALANVLNHPDIGNFKVTLLINKESYIVSEEIEAFLNARKKDDVVLIYFSCHGLRDDDGNLFFASINTNIERLQSTTIPSDFVNTIMIRCRSKTQILLLDCCYSGAFPKGKVAKTDRTAITEDKFQGGTGRIILTSTDSTSYSFE